MATFREKHLFPTFEWVVIQRGIAPHRRLAGRSQSYTHRYGVLWRHASSTDARPMVTPLLYRRPSSGDAASRRVHVERSDSHL